MTDKHEDLLSELESVQSLLDKLEGKDTPAKTADSPADPNQAQPSLQTSRRREEQIPLLSPQGVPPTLPEQTPNTHNNKAPGERPNPFLPKQALEQLEESRNEVVKQLGDLENGTEGGVKGGTPENQRTSQGNPGPVQLSDAEIRAMADEVLAEWLPKIERSLRATLMDAIRRKQES